MVRWPAAAVMVAVSAPAQAAATPHALALDAAVAAYARGDFAAARRQLRPFADCGSAIAETLLGVMDGQGQGGARDPAAAVGWWLRAANRGYGPAQLAMAKALANGRGVGADVGRAWIWARLAANAGTATDAEAARLAAALARGLSAADLAALEARRAAWRPWPGQ